MTWTEAKHFSDNQTSFILTDTCQYKLDIPPGNYILDVLPDTDLFVIITDIYGNCYTFHPSQLILKQD